MTGMTRRAAAVMWGSMLLVPLFFLALAGTMRWPHPHVASAEALFWATVVSSAVEVGLSRVLPPRLRLRQLGPEATAFTRLLVAWALCEAAAFFPVVAWIVTDDPRLIAVCILGLLALALLYPGDRRWARLSPRPDAPPVEGADH
jgi:hypothetical protein